MIPFCDKDSDINNVNKTIFTEDDGYFTEYNLYSIKLCNQNINMKNKKNHQNKCIHLVEHIFCKNWTKKRRKQQRCGLTKYLNNCWFLLLLITISIIGLVKSVRATDNNFSLDNVGIVDQVVVDGIYGKEDLQIDGSSSSQNNNNNNNNNNSGDLDAFMMRDSNRVFGGGASYSEKVGNLEKSIAAVFNKVAYGSTTTKRSIPDNVFIPSLTTVPTPPLTTYRYRDKDHFDDPFWQKQNQQQQQLNYSNRNYELELERDHALPTSAPNADVLKSNNNPTYPNPNRHHHERHKQHSINSTPVPILENAPFKKGLLSGAGDMPSYSPPPRASFTPAFPAYQYPFADKPTLRGTNSDITSYSNGGGGGSGSGGGSTVTSNIGIGLVGTGSGTGLSGIGGGGSTQSRRPIPPPSLLPGQERIPFRPPDLTGGGGLNIGIGPNNSSNTVSSTESQKINNKHQSTSLSSSSILEQQQQQQHQHQQQQQQLQQQRKKALNTPAQTNKHKTDLSKDLSHPDDTPGGGASNSYPKLHYSSISRILSGPNGRKEDIPEVLLRTVTARPNFQPSSPANFSPLYENDLSVPKKHLTGGYNRPEDEPLNDNEEDDDNDDDNDDNNNDNNEDAHIIDDNNESNDDNDDDDGDSNDFDMFDSGGFQPSHEEPKTQPKTKMMVKSTQSPLHQSDLFLHSTHIIQNPTNNNNSPVGLKDQHTTLPTTVRSKLASAPGGSISNIGSGGSSGPAATWTIAWNIHVYLSAILFTILAVYSIFKMIFYDKLTHLFNQSYFICIHLILICICLARIFFLCYDAYNIHFSFHQFVSELLLNLPATFLTISFAILILFMLIRTLDHKKNRYSSVMRPITIVIGSSVHVGLCITLHYVESTTTTTTMVSAAAAAAASSINNQDQQIFYPSRSHQQASVGGGVSGNSGWRSMQQSGGMNSQPPRVLTLICQIIYIFVCLSLGLFYLYIYRILKRILRNKSQNYIHGYQNVSYAIHVTIATALLFILLAALQVYGAISISTTRPLISQSPIYIDWLQCGYQFSLRLIEIAIITLMAWVTGLKTGSSTANKIIMQRNDKTIGGSGGGGGGSSSNETHNVSGFALFPCTSSSSQEHFETDYPAICNANTNLHTYTLRTGKPIYDDNYSLDPIGGSGVGGAGGGGGGGGVGSTNKGNTIQHQQIIHQSIPPLRSDGRINNTGDDEFKVTNSNEFTRMHDMCSTRSSTHTHSEIGGDISRQITDAEFLNDSGTMTDHYENPNFELRPNRHRNTAGGGGVGGNNSAFVTNGSDNEFHVDSCYSEPTTATAVIGLPVGAPLPSTNKLRDNTSRSVMQSINSTYDSKTHSQFDFQNFEKPSFDRALTTSSDTPNLVNSTGGGGGTEFRASKNLKVLKSSIGNCGHNSVRLNFDNQDQRRSSNTFTNGSGGGIFFNNLNNNNNNSSNSNNHHHHHHHHQQNHHHHHHHQSNSFDRHGIRKSGTLNNICGGQNNANCMHNRNGCGASSTSSNSSHGGGCRSSGVQTLSSNSRSHNNFPHHNNHHHISSSSQQQFMEGSGSGNGVGGAGVIPSSSSSHLQRNVTSRLSHQQQQHHTSHKNHQLQSSIDKNQAMGFYPLDDEQQLDNSSQASSDDGGSSGGECNDSGEKVHVSTGGTIRFQSDRGYKQQHNSSVGNKFETNQQEIHHSSSSDSATSGSMLVAEHGFVRFRAIDNIQQQQQPPSQHYQQSPQQPQQIVATQNLLGLQQHSGTSFRTTGRNDNKERPYVDS